jgi:hypothetical protein
MKARFMLMAILITASTATKAQTAPAASHAAPGGSSGLPVSGTLHYDLRYSQTIEFGGSQDGQQRSFASGDASYANLSKRLPFSMQYGGGYGWVLAGPSSAGNLYQHLSLSQGIVGHKWNLTASDNVSYTFETPTTGFSGVPGTGEPIGGTGSTTPPDQTILTQNTRTLDNVTTIAFEDKLNYATTLNLSGVLGQLRFIDNNGQNMDTRSANAGITRRLNARNYVTGMYSFSRQSYGNASFTTQTNTALLSFSRQWNRQLTTTVAAGPVWFSGSGTTNSENMAMPNSTMLSLNASANYKLRRGSASVSYLHGTTSGSGYMLGAKIDNVNGNFSREFGKNMTVGVTGANMRTSSIIAAEMTYDYQGVLYLIPLSITPVTDARYGGVQATRKLGRYFNVFVNYTAIDQSSNLQTAVPNTPLSYNTNILNGLNQVMSFGIGYSPREMRFRK